MSQINNLPFQRLLILNIIYKLLECSFKFQSYLITLFRYNICGVKTQAFPKQNQIATQLHFVKSQIDMNGLSSFEQDQNNIHRIQCVDKKPLNPQKLLIILINNDFKSLQCTQQVNSQTKKAKLQQEVRYLKEKLLNIISSNQKIIYLLRQRDDKTEILGKLVIQRDRVDLKLGVQSIKNKFTSKKGGNQGIKSLKLNKKNKLKSNLKQQKSQNNQMRVKLLQMKQYISKIQNSNDRLFQQRNIVHLNDSLEPQNSLWQKTSKMKQQRKFAQNINYDSSSEIWFRKIEQIKNNYLNGDQECHKRQIVEDVDNLRKHTPINIQMSKPNSKSHIQNQNILSERFWSSNFRAHRYKSSDKCQIIVSSPKYINSVYFFKQPIIFERLCSESDRSLGRVKSLNTIDTTCGSNRTSYRSIYQ